MMMPVVAILKKDLRSFFGNPMFYILAGLCSLLWAIFFSIDVYNFIGQSFQQSSQDTNSGLNIHQHLIANYIVVVHYVLVFVIAAFNMKFFSEEKKLKTFPLLLSSPVTSWQLVVAKTFVGAVVLLALLSISAILPLSLVFFTDVPMGLFLLSYFGAFLVLMAYVSAGVLASALTDSLIVSVVLAIVFNIGLLLMGVGREFTDSPVLKEFFHFLSIDYHFSFFRMGDISFASIVFLVSLSLFFGFISERVIEFHRWK